MWRAHLFIYSFTAIVYSFFAGLLLLPLLLFFLFCFLVFCCFAVLSKHFIINLQLIWAEMIPVLCSNPDPRVAIWPSVLITITKPRISIVSCIVCNVDIMATKSWKTVIAAVRGPTKLLGYVLFKISITVVVFQ